MRIHFGDWSPDLITSTSGAPLVTCTMPISVAPSLKSQFEPLVRVQHAKSHPPEAGTVSNLFVDARFVRAAYRGRAHWSLTLEAQSFGKGRLDIPTGMDSPSSDTSTRK